MSKVIVWLTFILAVFGLAMISSAGVYVSQKNFGVNYYYLNHQLIYGFLPGVLLFLAGRKINPRLWRKFSFLFILLAIGFLVMVFIPGFGISVGGAKRWFNFFGFFSFQPSEVLKLALIIYLASWLSKIKFEPAGIIAFMAVIFFVGLLIIAQPDMGTLAIVIGIALALFFASGASFKHIAGIILVIGVLFALLIFFSPYRFERFLTFLNPDLDIKGSGYHLNQSLIAIGKGGFWGAGFGEGEQKFGFLPEPVGDSIFAVIGEELGFFGMALVLSLLFSFVFVCFVLARKSPDKFSALFAIGLGSWVGLQSFINIASLTRLAPFTGIPLPFISYGGTSLAILMLAAGILAKIAK